MPTVTFIKNFKMASPNIKYDIEEYIKELRTKGTLLSLSSVPDNVNKRIKVVVRVTE